jgi:Tfp pilus assembly protein PilF
MHPSLKTLSAACASALLVACADMGSASRPMAPGRAHAGLSADDAYVLARQQHLASRWPAAIDNYQAALRANPRHVNANNGLATLYAEQGNLPKAIGIWRELTVDAPDSATSAFIHSNLGYAYLLNGDFQLAIASLEKACVLDPFSARAWRHLGDALVKVGDDERAQRMFRQADALDRHDLRHDLAVTAAQAKHAQAGKPIVDVEAALAVSVQASAAVSAVADVPDLPSTEIRRTGSAMYELRRPERSSRAAPAPTAAPAIPPATASVVQASARGGGACWTHCARTGSGIQAGAAAPGHQARR